MDFQTISGLGCTALPGVTRPLAAAQPRHARPTQQPSEAPAEERVPKPNSASGGREKAPSRGRLARSQGCRGRLARSPGCGRIPGKGGVSITSGGISISEFIFVPPFFRFHLYIWRFFRGGTYLSLPGDLSLYSFKGHPVPFGTATLDISFVAEPRERGNATIPISVRLHTQT